MSASLVGVVAGLALLDALNPATIGLVALILLLPTESTGPSATARRGSPVALGAGVAVGAALTVFAVGCAVYLAADTAAVAGGLVWVRRLAFGAAGVVLLVTALRRLRPRDVSAVALPGWFSVWTAVPTGVLVTGADLPNAFPYFIAIERMAAAGIGVGAATLLLAGYAVVYCLPCLVLLGVGQRWGDRVRGGLSGLYRRFGAARRLPRSVPLAAAYGAGAVALIAVAASA
ncbi:hypothetical protein [Actinomycetospora straminea]|uniref:Sap-like sulfolipid-1-addressing protein n=1 Tax=Actinomycetospora straminea TaxID=663607 RepID=A0ABP9ENV1_9PSEU|nr:hypothetical protein [Actinomycetospora straminea]MDD7933110.1 hypothetical protein [Actinomycetospora straminea]